MQQLVQDPCTKSPGLITWDEKQPLSCNLAHKTHQNSSSIALFFFFFYGGRRTLATVTPLSSALLEGLHTQTCVEVEVC